MEDVFRPNAEEKGIIIHSVFEGERTKKVKREMCVAAVLSLYIPALPAAAAAKTLAASRHTGSG